MSSVSPESVDIYLLNHMPEEIKFHSDNLFAGQTGVVDSNACVIKGASLIQTGEAEGHGLIVDQKLLQQLQACAKTKGKISINLDHGSGISSTCGYAANFRLDDNKLRGDLHLLKTHRETPTILELATEMPGCFGLSVAFKPDKSGPKGEPIGQGKFAARCSQLMSIDLVCRPAANAGLFSVPVDTQKNTQTNFMANENTDPSLQQAEPTLADVMKAVQELQGKFAEQDKFNQSVIEQFGGSQEGQEPTLEEIAQMSDEALAQIGLTRADVDNAIAEIDAEEAHAAEAQGKGEGEAEGQGEGAAQAATAGVSSELAALKKEVLSLRKKQDAVEFKAKQDAEEIELAAIEEKALTLAKQRDDAIKLAEKANAENEALRLHIKTGTRPVKAGVDNGIRMFSADNEGELHEFQVRVKQLKDGGKTEAEALRFAQKENPASHADWVQSLKPKATV